MAMTKKERAEFEAALLEARICGALRWTAPVPRDVEIPVTGIVNGWLFNEHSREVAKSCSSCTAHSFGYWDKTTTQRPTRLYSTRLLALRGLRHALERQYAEELAKVDSAIAEELTATN